VTFSEDVGHWDAGLRGADWILELPEDPVEAPVDDDVGLADADEVAPALLAGVAEPQADRARARNAPPSPVAARTALLLTALRGTAREVVTFNMLPSLPRVRISNA
jgi:hypothetical protein